MTGTPKLSDERNSSTSNQPECDVESFGKSRFCVGIDLGTSNSAMAFVNEQGQPETLRNAEGDLTTPSVVYCDSQELIIGTEAFIAARDDHRWLIKDAKRKVGSNHRSNTNQPNIPPEVILAAIVRKLKLDGERQLGPLSTAVIAVPGFFDESSRRAIVDVGFLAGFEQVHLVRESIAAVIACMNRLTFDASLGEKSGSKSTKSELALVYDLGGGTFDATLIEMKGLSFHTIAATGDRKLGGMDWDQKIANWLRNQLGGQIASSANSAAATSYQIVMEAERVKKSLSVRHETIAHIPGRVPAQGVNVLRGDMERETTTLAEGTLQLCRELLAQTGLDWQDLSRIILVGGSTRIPLVQKMLCEASGLPLFSPLMPDEIVAQGAALFGKSLSVDSVDANHSIAPNSEKENIGHLRVGQNEQIDSPSVGTTAENRLEIRNVTTHDFSVLGLDAETGIQRRQVMIPKNSTLPAKATKRFLTAREGQSSVVVTVVEGGEGRTALGSTRLGVCRVMDLPAFLPKGSCVAVTFWFSADGQLSVEAELPDLGNQATTIMHLTNNLSPNEKRFWKHHLWQGLDWRSVHAKDHGITVDSESECPQSDFGTISLPDEASESELEELLVELSSLKVNSESFLEESDSEQNDLIPFELSSLSIKR